MHRDNPPAVIDDGDDDHPAIAPGLALGRFHELLGVVERERVFGDYVRLFPRASNSDRRYSVVIQA